MLTLTTSQTPTANKVKVALYTRVSTTMQANEGVSLSQQEEMLKKYCEEHNYEIVKIYSDKGISGKDIKGRPAMKQLLMDATKKDFDLVMSWKLSRISRSVKDVLEIFDTFERNNIKYKSLTENFETETPSGRMVFQIMAVVNEMERNQISDNVSGAMSYLASQGYYLGGCAPLGYDLKSNHSGDRRTSSLVINEQEAMTIRLIFDLYTKGWGYKRIANHINAMGMKSKKGHHLAISTIRDILTNPIYVGLLRYNNYTNWSKKRRKGKNPNPIIVKGIHEPIISEEVWEKALVRMKGDKKAVKKHNGFYPLTGILKCPECGASMVLGGSSQQGKRIFYYICGNFHSKGSSACHSNGIRCDKANEAVLNKLVELLNNDKFADAVIERMREKQNSSYIPQQDLMENFRKELEKINTSKERLFELYESELISKEEFLKRKQKLDERKEVLKNSTEEVQANMIDYNTLDSKTIKDILKQFKTILLQANDQDEVKLLLKTLIKKITIDADRNIDTIKLHIDENIIRLIYSDNTGEMPTGISSFALQKIQCELTIMCNQE